MRIPLALPSIGASDLESVAGVLRSGRLSRGPRLAEFERALASRVGTAHAVGVSSGTAGLHLALRASGIVAGDEVITSPFSFVASTNCILYQRALPAFVDVDPVSLNLDPAAIEAALSPRTRAILVVHALGRAAPMPEILAIARRHGLIVIEDACEALGARVAGREVGSFGSCGVFSFYPNKQLTTGEGGMIVSDDGELSRLCRRLRNQGRDDGDARPVELGFNYRLAELPSALGLSQLGRLDEELRAREAIARKYHERLLACDALVLPPPATRDGRSSWFAYVVRLAPRFDEADRDEIARALQRRGIATGLYFPPIHLMPHVREVVSHQSGDFPVAEAASARCLALPFFARITVEQLDEVCEMLLKLVGTPRGRR